MKRILFLVVMMTMLPVLSVEAMAQACRQSNWTCTRTKQGCFNACGGSANQSCVQSHCEGAYQECMRSGQFKNGYGCYQGLKRQ